MKFTCSRSELAEAIMTCGKGCAVKSSMPALERLKFRLDHGSLEILGYDNERGIRCCMEVDSDDEGEFLAPSRLFGEAIRRMTGATVLVEVEANYTVRITCDASKFRLLGLSADEYPMIMPFEEEGGIEIGQTELASMIRQTAYATSTNESRPIMNGLSFSAKDGVLTVVGIDGYRLAVRREKIASQNELSFVVPRTAFNELSGILHSDSEEPCSIISSGRSVVFTAGAYQVFSRLTEGEFPKYTTMIPSSASIEIEIDTAGFLQIIERCALLLSAKDNEPLRCHFENGVFTANCKTSTGEYNDQMLVEQQGDAITIGFNNGYLHDALRTVECDKVRLQMTSAQRVCVISPLEGDAFLFLLMPVHLRV